MNFIKKHKLIDIQIMSFLIICCLFTALPCAYGDCIKGNCIDGQGTLTWANGDKYVGIFKDGSRTGQGTWTGADGNKYTGEFKDGKFNGQGTYTWPNGNKYEGEFKNGKFTGQGTYTWPNGNTYVGELKDGKLIGQGTWSETNGNKYVGEFKDGKRAGQGTWTEANGNKYVGSFKDDKFNGQGIWTAADGDKYAGEFKDGRRAGQGIWTEANGNQYEGLFKDDKFNGQGTYTWSDGDKYVGEFKDGKSTGQGAYSLASGGKTGIDVNKPLIYAEKEQNPKKTVVSPAVVKQSNQQEGEEFTVSKPEVPSKTVFGKYYALVIGNNNYSSFPKLKTAKNDAQAISNILKNNYGFDVILLLDANRSDILVTFARLREKLSNRDNLLIYYAGHSYLDKDGDEGYWLPVDATNNDEVNWISNSSITTQLKAMEAKHVLVVADSCYSGKLGRDVHIVKRTPDYYSRIAQKKARSVIASGGLEPVIDSGGNGDHSVFSSALLVALQENNGMIDATELFGKIRRQVVLNADQTPEYADIRKAGHEGGEFVLIREK